MLLALYEFWTTMGFFENVWSRKLGLKNDLLGALQFATVLMALIFRFSPLDKDISKDLSKVWILLDLSTRGVFRITTPIDNFLPI